MQEKVCCFIGHREIEEAEKLRDEAYDIVERLILEENVDTFLFGSKSQFNDLCYEVVSDIKEKYPHIKRIYVRAAFPYVDDSYIKYLLSYYEETYFPEKLLGADKARYVERNVEMINKSKFCVIYCRNEYIKGKRKSGAKIALDYALQKQKTVYLL